MASGIENPITVKNTSIVTKSPSLLFALCFFSFQLFANDLTPFIQRVDPANWWVGMKNPELQLLIYGKNLKGSDLKINYPGVTVRQVYEVENTNYLFVDLYIAPETKAGKFDIELSLTMGFRKGKKFVTETVRNVHTYELRTRDKHPQEINSKDLVYLILPDRFSNGDASNDKFADMADPESDRANPYLRHGGDLLGIQNHLDYFTELGVTTLWLNPVIENNQPQTNEGGAMRSAYHGYGFTDHYAIDRRLGGNAAYKNLVDAAHAKGLKIIQDAVYNHVGINHWILRDLPMKNWLNQWDAYTNTSYRDEAVIDLNHGSQSDFKVHQNGWFVPFLPDLNQHNDFVANYLIQHALWTVEYFGIDGWRVDTYQYNDLEFMNRCNNALYAEYPNMFITAENAVNTAVSQAFFVRNNLYLPFKSSCNSPNDFVFFNAINAALNEKFDWGHGFNQLCTMLAQDMVYEDPNMNLTFLDNHDQHRFFSVIGEDIQKYKQGMTFLLTARGVPQLYYGTEVLMKNFKNPSDAEVRRDFPGGWSGDRENKFLVSGRTALENEAFNFTKKLAQYRKSCTALQTGKLTQYIPKDGIYVYFRQNEAKTVMVVMSQSDQAQTLPTQRFVENMRGFTQGKNILDDSKIVDLSQIAVPAMSVQVIELLR
ncbi:MAG: cyclomaltodextrinase N-terminal domain-containing protein [Phycisphaerae bacterium]|nr:cyclomaltodextrinase N-terminal domain-containing protein [Saprospiraceae bacterium]